MYVPYIDQYSAKCMLGKLSKNIKQEGSVLSWESQKRKHIVLIDDKIDFGVLHRIGGANFHYLSEETLEIMKANFRVKSSPGKSVVQQITQNFSGKKNRRFRNYLNRYGKLSVEPELRKISDLSNMLKEWSVGMGSKYFRDMSTKNKFFIENGFHKGCENVFVYKDEQLVSFGVLSPIKDGRCAYIIGKALSHIYPGLAEFTDLSVYRRIGGEFMVNLGQGEGGLLAYKMKFPGAFIQAHYDGSYEV